VNGVGWKASGAAEQSRESGRDWDWDQTYPSCSSSAETTCFVLVLDVLAGGRRSRIQGICKVCLCSARPELLSHTARHKERTHLNGLLGLGRGGLSGIGLGLHLQTLFG
jgi:hypothetical protein